MIFIIITIIGSCSIKYFWKDKYQIPYTFILLLFGSLLVIISEYTHYDEFNTSMFFWKTLDPHMILLIFIPPLIYNSAAHINFHILKKLWKSITMLIVPGVVFSTFFIGFLIKYIDNSFTWTTSFLLGSLLSATDPIAVVSILNSMGINKKLSILIDGESLLNDGTASIIFAIIIKILEKDSTTSIIINAIQLSFGSILYGLAFSLISFFILKQVYDNEVIEISMTLIFPHLMFYVAENIIHVSGILSISILGFFTSYSKYTAITPHVRKSIEHVWHVIDFIANNIIFVLTGLIIISNLLNNNIPFSIWLNMFNIYLCSNLSRFVITFIFYPVLRNKQYKLYMKEICVVALSGLRGEITLALALIATSVKEIDGTVQDRIIFYSGGIVFLSILINSILIKLFIKKFIINENENDIVFEEILHIRKHISDVGQKSIIYIKNNNKFLNNINWEDVNNHIVKEDSCNNNSVEISINRIINCKIVFLKCLKKSFWDLYHKHMIYRDAIIHLVELIDTILESEDCNWEHVIEPYCKKYNDSVGNSLFQYFQKKILFYHINHHYSIVSGFILGQYNALGLLTDILDNEDEDLLNILKNECEKSINKGIEYINFIESNYPDISNKIETRQSIHFILKKQQEYLKSLSKNGEINQHLYHTLLNDINKNFYKSHWV